MKKWQRSLLAVLSFCLCLLPMTVSATEEDGESISVGNVTLTPETEYAKTDMGTVTTEGATQEDYNIRWEASSATLTLNGAEISAEDISAIQADIEKLTISLIGENRISAKNTQENVEFFAIQNSGEIEFLESEEDSSLTISVSQAAESGSTEKISGIYTGAGLVNNATLFIEISVPSQAGYSDTIAGIIGGEYEEQSAFLKNTGKITAEIQNQSLTTWSGADVYGILIYSGGMENSGELDLTVSTVNGDAYGLRGTSTSVPWQNNGLIRSDVVAYGGNYEGVSEELHKGSNHACAVSVVSDQMEMTNAGTMELTAKNAGNNLTAEYAIGLELDSSSSVLNNTGTIHCRAYDAYTWGIYLSNLTDNATLTNSGSITIEATTDGQSDGEQIGPACATGIGINMDNFETDPVPVRTELVLEPGSSLSISTHAAGDVDSPEEVTYMYCQAIQLQKIYYGGDPQYDEKPQEIMLADDLIILKDGEYDGGAPLTEFLEDYIDLGMYVYINTIGNYFTNPEDGSVYSVPSKTVTILPSLTGNVVISGTAEIGQTLVAETSGIPDNISVSYQWQSGDTADGMFYDISGATEAAYMMTNEDAGKYIRVVVTPVAGSGYAGRLSATTETGVSTPSSGGGGSSSYSISVDKNIDNGSVTVSPKSASSGRTVTITVKPDEGYELDELTVTDKNGDEIELTDKGDGKYTFKMPRSKVTIEASFVEIDHQDTCPAAGFRDVDEDAWYHEAVDYALDNGLMSGVSDREFAPGSTLTRAMVAQMLYSLEGKPAAGRADFADVAEGAWYADAISWAAGEGIVSGYGDTFGPNDPITREQLAAILYRYAQNEGYKTSQSGKGTEGYLDASSISSYAVKAMDWAVNAGLLSGKGNNTLAPTAGATRAEVAQIFMNFCEDIAK